MAHADLVQDVFTDMSGLEYNHPKYADTFRKVNVGMVIVAGKNLYF